ncbi:iron-containing alcohol dehydrogenase [Cloacibacillus sp. An23]|uniref:iron-containing alcohol dehydrogenase n=1 Tax=Cloacibacillus sp. An23 TaxID=1965591 RepID=UPI0013023E34|nr:iron-containing alcohol dehydrogenase [Cloacibacillus sp. An23]
MFADYKFGAGRYFQEKGALSAAGMEAARHGGRAYIIGGPRAMSAVGEKIIKSFRASGVEHETEIYPGYPTEDKIKELAVKLKDRRADVIVGVGGGRVIDAAKAAAGEAGISVITVPTTAATCAAYTPVSPCYFQDGRFDKTLWHENEVAAVIADTDVIAAAPERYIVSGMLDAMAKYVEMANGGIPGFAATPADRHGACHLAKYIFDTLEECAEQAVRDAHARIHTKLLDDVCFINIALTGMVSGMTRGKGQTAAAHAFYNGVRRLFCKEARSFLHGEIVAVGLLSQCAYNSDMKLAAKLRGFMRRLGVPTSLAELGVAETDENLSALFDFMKTARFMQAPGADEELLRESLELTRGERSAQL